MSTAVVFLETSTHIQETKLMSRVERDKTLGEIVDSHCNNTLKVTINYPKYLKLP
jgi:hypothetical protein